VKETCFGGVRRGRGVKKRVGKVTGGDEPAQKSAKATRGRARRVPEQAKPISERPQGAGKDKRRPRNGIAEGTRELEVIRRSRSMLEISTYRRG